MSDTLLPTGCYDVLPPFARLESQLDQQLLNHFESYGYEQVSPPLFEYTDSLLAGRGRILSPQVVRVMDPHNQKVMGIRADMTLQIGRIALSRMENAPRPLRLCYSGQILRLEADVTARRQMQQTGIELIGAKSLDGDIEVMLVTLRSLQSIGVGHITLDLNLPAFIGAILSESPLDDNELSTVFRSLAHKDSTRLKQFNEPACDLLCDLMLASGDATDAIEKVSKANVPDSVANHIEDLRYVIQGLEKRKGDNVDITLDVTERGGLDYYTGISFTCFATEQNMELGRGGRYTIDRNQTRESAIGSTLYTERLKRLMPKPPTPSRVYVAEGFSERDITALHDQGYVTILALPGADDHDIGSTARAFACEYIYQSGSLEKI